MKYTTAARRLQARDPLATVALVLANLLAYCLELTSGGVEFCASHGLVPARFMRSGDLGPLFSSMFLHDPAGLSHIAGNMAFLAFFGTLVERSIGSLRFLAVYLAAGVAGALMHVLVNPAATDPLVGASGAIFGVMAVAAVVRPRLVGFVASYAAYNLAELLLGSGGSVSVGCHVGGFVVGVGFVFFARASRSDCLEAA
jgi:membrane associated rhomboid family serine protease